MTNRWSGNVNQYKNDTTLITFQAAKIKQSDNFKCWIV